MQCDKNVNPTTVGRERTKSLALRQMQHIERQDFVRDKEIERTRNGLKEAYNPLFKLPVDLYRYKIMYIHTIAIEHPNVQEYAYRLPSLHPLGPIQISHCWCHGASLAQTEEGNLSKAVSIQLLWHRWKDFPCHYKPP